MINVTKLLCGTPQPADALRYGEGPNAPRSAAERKPVMVWNITRRCNLRCLHCYSDSEAREYPGELSFDECRMVIDDLAEYGIPGLLLSGGEPTIHPRFFDLASYAVHRGLRITLSTNGTLIDADSARRLKALGIAYVGISLDGIGATHDHFRGRQGAFDKAVAAFGHCRAADQKSGLRLTLTPHTVADLPAILALIEEENIQRVCFYHLVYSGRGNDLGLLSRETTRAALTTIAEAVLRWHRQGTPREVLTVDQPADGVFFWKYAKEHVPEREGAIARLLAWNGGGANGSGIGLANIDSQGRVHPDQFWQDCDLGNVRDQPFSRIWADSDDPTLTGLRNRIPRLQGRCGTCRFRTVCGGGFRVRAWQRHTDPWAEDPGCPLTDEEIRAETEKPGQV